MKLTDLEWRKSRVDHRVTENIINVSPLNSKKLFQSHVTVIPPALHDHYTRL